MMANPCEPSSSAPFKGGIEGDEESASPRPLNAKQGHHGNLFLIGYRGAGKTTVGRLLAELMGWSFVDMDEELERRHGSTIRALFDSEGEAGFRSKEADLLAERCRGERIVIATGGGVVLSGENRDRLRTYGRVIWLTADPEVLCRRLQSDERTSDRRPDLGVGGLAEIREFLAEREPLYRACAELIVDTAGRTPEDVTHIILRQLTPP